MGPAGASGCVVVHVRRVIGRLMASLDLKPADVVGCEEAACE